MLILKLVTLTWVGISLAYLGISWFVADRLTRPERYPPAATPDSLGLAYEPVEFESADDGLTLRRWWIHSRDSGRAVILVHGRNSNRSSIDPPQGTDGGLLRQTKVIVEQGYSVLTFDLRGHGQPDGDRYSLEPLERPDVLGAISYVRGISTSGHRLSIAACPSKTGERLLRV